MMPYTYLQSLIVSLIVQSLVSTDSSHSVSATQLLVKFSGKQETLVMPLAFFLSLSIIGSAAFLLGSLLQEFWLLPVILFTGVIFWDC